MGRINVTSRIFAGALVPNMDGVVCQREACNAPGRFVQCHLECELALPAPWEAIGQKLAIEMLEEARKLTSSREILLWMTPSEAPKALQASECSELLDPMRASCWIFAQH